MKTKSIIELFAALVLLLTLDSQISRLFAQGTSFTYQGSLTTATGLGNGNYDMTFSLYDASSNGSLVAGPLTNSATAVTNGLFTVTLDFDGSFSGSDRWLQIGVRTNGGGAFSLLTPRQKITPTPYAIFSAGSATATTAGTAASANTAATAGTASNFTGSLAGDVIGTQGATTVASVGGQSAANVAGGASAANAATSANTPGTIVERDSSGNFAAGAVTATSLSGDGSGLGNLNGASIQAGTVGATQIASGAIGTNQLASGSASANLQANGQSAVVSGGVILSANSASPALTSAGYVRIGQTGIGELWAPQGSSPLSPRYYHSAVWTGKDVIIWGGQNGSTFFGDGARYNVASNTWTTISTIGAPAPRTQHVAFWTGTEMIIWGGVSSAGCSPNGARYNPSTDTWTPISNLGAPVGALAPAAVWSGSEMIIWGGEVSNNPSYTQGGGRYNPLTDSWTALPTNGAPSARYALMAVWTGTNMIVWGGLTYGVGYGSITEYGDGAIFDPTANVWTGLPSSGAPTARTAASAVWTGSQMIIWGGWAGSDLGDGAIYNPASNGWSTLPSAGAPEARDTATSIWTGTELVVWGGQISNGGVFNDGGRYNPTLGIWSSMTLSGAPTARFANAAVWTGNNLLISGGAAPSNPSQWFNDTYIYQPPSTMYLYMRQ